jgi:uroporphyrinogen-III synthase
MTCSTTRVVKMGIDYGNIKILSTNTIDVETINNLKEKNIFIDTIPFTATVPLVNNYLIEKIHHLATKDIVAVFTHPDAVLAVANILHQQSVSWHIACLAKHTHYAAQDAFPNNNILLTASTETALAQQILDTDIAKDTIVYFCGNTYANTLPTLFKLQQQSLDSIMVYQTLVKSTPITDFYNGIIFTSLSAIDSFFVFNKFPNNTVAFCLTEDIAHALTKHLQQATVVVQAKEASLPSLLESILIYYNLS